ncbi:MAG: beta galactosidase jelly roll domain-containing protein [Anaerolineae bacterium]|nr:beta galactosidase jelly roll domain-containing protein [Anaerolineae bacterium]
MTRVTCSLDGAWQFQIDRDEKGEERGWHEPAYEPKGWLGVEVPGSWDTYLDGLFGFAGHCWFRTTFAAVPDASDGRVVLCYEGANYETTVWLNGALIGVHRGGFDPFEFDVTDRLNRDGDNVLVARVDNWPKVNRVPNSLAGWWNYGGIYRSVRLLVMPAVRIADVFVRAEPGEDATAAPLAVEATIANDGDDSVEVAISVGVGGPAGAAELSNPLSADAVTIPAHGETVVSLGSGIVDAALWSPETPNLYELQVSLAINGVQADAQAVRFGVRKFEVRGTRFYLNGEPIWLAGFNRHEEYAGTGRVDPGGVLERDICAIKEMNGNLVRMHYQAHPDMYDLCDELGLMCFSEIPMWQVGVKDLNEWDSEEVWETTEVMMRTLVGSLRNHPSVIIWSVGNECATNKDESRPLISHLAELTRSLDDTRPVAYVGMYGPDEVVNDLVDIPCANGYPGFNTASFAERIEAIHALQPDKPLLMTEFGHESVRGLHGEGYGTEDEQAEVLEGIWRTLHERSDWLAGTIIWCLADYWHMPMGPDFHWMNRIYFCHGVMTLDRKPKMAAEAVKRLWGNE